VEPLFFFFDLLDFFAPDISSRRRNTSVRHDQRVTRKQGGSRRTVELRADLADLAPEHSLGAESHVGEMRGELLKFDPRDLQPLRPVRRVWVAGSRSILLTFAGVVAEPALQPVVAPRTESAFCAAQSACAVYVSRKDAP
jgi:hypothetical protein